MNLEQLTESFSDLACYELNASGGIVGWDHSAEKLLGYSSAEAIGKSMSQFAGQGASCSGPDAIQIAARTGRHETFGWVVRKDRSCFWGNEITAASPASGDGPRYVRIIRDVTAWKAMLDDRDRVFNLSSDLICVAGFDGLFKRINPSFSRILGYDEHSLLSRPYVDFVHPQDVEATRAESEALVHDEQGAARVFRNRYRRADGSYRWFEWKSHAVMKDRLIYAIARDVTEQQEIEQKVRDYSVELERSNGDLQQFAYVASHDLQEPLRAVAGCVHMLGERNEGKLDAQSLELMAHAIDGAKRMQKLINDLLAFSRVGSKGITKAAVNVGEAVQKAIRQLQIAIAESQAVIDVEAMPQAWADPVQLAQIFQNLIANAVKFRRGPGPHIRISARQTPTETIFSVRDDGIGIAPEYHHRLFGLFQRVVSRTEYEGTGIGLAICKKIAERHGGRIWVESQVGQGADFQFSIPLRNAA